MISHHTSHVTLEEIAKLPTYPAVNPEGLLYCVFQSQGRSHNLFSDFHISEDVLEQDGLIVKVELNELPPHMYSTNLILFNLIQFCY